MGVEVHETDTLYVGNYTLTETWTQEGYLGLSAPVMVAVTGEGVSCEDRHVTVTGDVENGYLVTVHNVETKALTVTKTLIDPLIEQRKFSFTVSYSWMPDWQYGGEGTALAESETFTLTPEAADSAADEDAPGAVSWTVRVPAGADVTVAEDTDGLTDVYETTVCLNEGETSEGASLTIEDISADSVAAFTNSRRTAEITVQKVVDGAADTTAFPFTAILLNGAVPVTEYTVGERAVSGSGADASGSQGETDGNGTDATDTGILTTDETGAVSFALAHGNAQTLTVPVGTRLVVRESAEGYRAEIVSETGTADGDAADNSFTMIVTGDDTITFTNTPSGVFISLVKVGVNNTDPSAVQTPLGGAYFTVYEAVGDHLDQKGSPVEVDGVTLRNLASDDTTGVIWSGTLAAGTYLIEENKAPGGYYKINVLIKMVVSGGEVSLSHIGTAGNPETMYKTPSLENEVWTVTLINTAGYALPSTGGPGTGFPVAAGLVLMALASAGFVVKRRLI